MTMTRTVEQGTRSVDRIGRAMAGFQYQHGDQPLAGYTVERAVGRGGFGEVYYAMSESGREVALKVIKGYEQIEIRGVSQCMNLKSPHLVSIFDIKHADDGTPFVIMEYVAGPSLRELLDDAPAGLGVQKAAFFLRELAKGLTYLHDRGIVHRDLKPGNIFYEDGYVKIGDYGLSKAISASMHSGQTITVGSVHYMAPEVGQGRYDQSIDIYALGVLLYEMLTGQVPYFGASHGEILMKHLTAEPDLTQVEEPFSHVIRKALAKDPADRYASVQEMVEDVFGAEHIQASVSHFAPESLSMVAGRAAAKVRVGEGSSGQHGLGGGYVPSSPASKNRAEPGRMRIENSDGLLDMSPGRMRIENSDGILDMSPGRVSIRGPGSHEKSPPPASSGSIPYRLAKMYDPLSGVMRAVLGLMTLGVVAVGTTVIHMGQYRYVQMEDAFPPLLFLNLMMILGAACGLAIAQRFFIERIEQENWLIKRLTYIGPALGVGSVYTSFALFMMYETRGWGAPREEQIAVTLVAVVCALALMRWERCISSVRRDRLSLWYPLVAGGIAFGLALGFGGFAFMACGVVAGVALTVQIWTVYVPPHCRQAARLYAASLERQPAYAYAGAPGEVAYAPEAQPPQWQHHGDREQDPRGQAVRPTPSYGSPPPVPAYASTNTRYASPRRRLWALLFSLAPCVGVPVFGLHRFYAGKIGTGILWLCTFGFLWIGQIIDIILIASGSFRDKEGRPITIWQDEAGTQSARRASGEAYGREAGAQKVAVREHSPAAGEEVVPVRPMPGADVRAGSPGPREHGSSAKADHRTYDAAPSEVSHGLRSFGPGGADRGTHAVRRFMTNRPLAFLAFLLVAWACVTGAFKVLEIPNMIAAGAFGDEMPRDLTQALGYTQWPTLLENVAVFLCNSALVLGALLLLLARRRAGIVHMGRAVLGVLLLGFSLYALDFELRFDAARINVWLNEERIGPLLEYILAQLTRQGVLISFAITLAGGVLLIWPERDRVPADHDTMKGVV